MGLSMSQRHAVTKTIAARYKRASRVDKPLPLNVGASSKILLAWLPEEDALRLVAMSAARFDLENTYDRESLAKELREVRTERSAISIGARNPRHLRDRRSGVRPEWRRVGRDLPRRADRAHGRGETARVPAGGHRSGGTNICTARAPRRFARAAARVQLTGRAPRDCNADRTQVWPNADDPTSQVRASERVHARLVTTAFGPGTLVELDVLHHLPYEPA